MVYSPYGMWYYLYGIMVLFLSIVNIVINIAINIVKKTHISYSPTIFLRVFSNVYIKSYKKSKSLNMNTLKLHTRRGLFFGNPDDGISKISSGASDPTVVGHLTSLRYAPTTF